MRSKALQSLTRVDKLMGIPNSVVINSRKVAEQNVQRPLIRLLDADDSEVKIAGTDHAVTIQLPVGVFVVVRDG